MGLDGGGVVARLPLAQMVEHQLKGIGGLRLELLQHVQHAVAVFAPRQSHEDAVVGHDEFEVAVGLVHRLHQAAVEGFGMHL